MNGGDDGYSIPEALQQQWYVEIDYTNHRGERATRVVRPLAFFFKESEYHPGAGAQHLMYAWDTAKQAGRTFVMKDIHSWKKVSN